MFARSCVKRHAPSESISKDGEGPMRTSIRPGNFMAARGSWRRWLGPAVLAAAVSAAGGAHADDGVLAWIVKSISADEDGDIIQASAMRVPQVGSALVAGQQIATGGGQHMVLVNGRDLVEIRPNSTVKIGDDDASTADSNISLVNGTIHVEVGKRAPGKTFSIDAPYLVATVKGTQFDVSSSSEQTSVSVTEGVVAVSADASGASVDVTVGKTAVVGRRNADKPELLTPAGSSPGVIETDETTETTETASADDGGNAGGSDSDGSGGSNSGGSNSGGSSSGGS
ncbi:MAG TPA: FecR domain-containing protein, partial [Dongiaceae bacterium]|nr:FecR domain-containing protein [Dongiaceae bacterium]